MATERLETFRCMMCGHEYQARMDKDVDVERACPKCRSNSIRRLKKKAGGAQPSAISPTPSPKG
jgi:DNA-directed RNA polymerase subunit RPC12/RpoP